MTKHETASAAVATHGVEASHGEQAAHGSHAAPENLQALFTRDEIEQFDADDVNAGGTIGKMLALFFFYTVIVMSIVAWWTYKSSQGP